MKKHKVEKNNNKDTVPELEPIADGEVKPTVQPESKQQTVNRVVDKERKEQEKREKELKRLYKDYVTTMDNFFKTSPKIAIILAAIVGIVSPLIRVGRLWKYLRKVFKSKEEKQSIWEWLLE